MPKNRVFKEDKDVEFDLIFSNNAKKWSERQQISGTLEVTND